MNPRINHIKLPNGVFINLDAVDTIELLNEDECVITFKNGNKKVTDYYNMIDEALFNYHYIIDNN
ncbi:MAG: hypothetical protein COA71_14775 [SAR86 cluster bacterium]|uniref:Uncharacterized protein n=1 Tax=SAR86 cluster bacterium TaxID=2030880 RepID=A0A2A5C588_9GAMM|nr:MAG: hypothetical protein COA71_14775 [SAR86 cluster bacterium]